MSEWAVKGLQLFFALSILILLHEFGHFFFAKLFKTRVEKFYLFFDFLFPLSGVLNFSIFKKKIGDTEYGIGWFPMGGYVKIAGMVDESMDKDQMAKPPQPWEYRSKKPWQKLFIMLGGIIMNVLTAMFIYALIFGIWGEKYLPTQNLAYGIATDSLGQSIGLQNGDMVTSVDNKPVQHFNKVPLAIIFDEAKSIQVSRNGQPVNVNIPQGTIRKMLKATRGSFLQVRVPAHIDTLYTDTRAYKMGLRQNDSIIAVNDKPVLFFDEFETEKKAHYGQPMTITVMRGSQAMTLNTVLPKDSVLGIPVPDPERYMKFVHIDYSFGGAIARGFVYTFEQFGNYWKQFKLLLTSKEVKVNESLGGIGSFAKIFPSVFDWQDFLSLTAFVSIILAFMNLLPIPGLDGGYVIFLLYEMVTGRKVSDKVMEYATTAGLVLLLGLMLYANGLDIFRVFKH